MKNFATLLIAALAGLALAACEKHATNSVDATHAPKEGDTTAGIGETVHLKEGHGLAFHPKLQQNIGLKVAEVGEEKVAPEITARLHVIQGADNLRRVALTPGGGTEANGWLPAAKAALIKPGQEVELRSAGSATVEKGVVKRVEKSSYAALGDFEVVVETDAPFNTGTSLMATFRAPAGDAVTAVPREALLKTAEGTFVYAVNESFYMRTPVKVGAMNGQSVEITDGLYAGDQIVTAPVNTLWMAELQLLRGGKACTCGH